MKLFADEMLGKLAKWLRFLGHDTAYCEGRSDVDIILKSIREGRVVLTRDTRMYQENCDELRMVFIKDNDLKHQLIQVRDELSISFTDRAFMICAECNKPLKRVEKDEIADLVPPYIASTKSEFKYCENCKRVFWQGTHLNRITGLLKEVFSDG